MESTTPFDLTLAIQHWRETLGQSPAFRRENLDELEMHLRESVATLSARGLSLEESFLIATRRIGNERALAAEFGKVNRNAVWLDRVLWMLIGIQVWGLASGTIASVIRTLLSFAWPGSDSWSAESFVLPVIIFTLLQVSGVAVAAAFCWWLIVKQGSRIGTALKPMLALRPARVATFLALSVLTLLLHALSPMLVMLVVRTRNLDAFAQVSVYSSYAQMLVAPLTVIGLLAITFLLARRRLRLRSA
jgi:hypothetical protein